MLNVIGHVEDLGNIQNVHWGSENDARFGFRRSDLPYIYVHALDISRISEEK